MEIRDIFINKDGADTLGINIEAGTRGGVFVSSIGNNSLAARAGLFVGDQILEVKVRSCDL